MIKASAITLLVFGTVLTVAPSFANDGFLLTPIPTELYADPTARPLTVEPVDITVSTQVSVTAGSTQTLDMSGADGSLRSCYASGGIATQGQDMAYRCTPNDANSIYPSGFSQSSPTDSGYNGTSDVEDAALINCINRGGSLIQLVENNQFACAM